LQSSVRSASSGIWTRNTRQSLKWRWSRCQTPSSARKRALLWCPYTGAEFDFVEMTRYLTTRRVAKQKFPEYLEILPGLPETASGKVQKFRLREDAANKASARSGQLSPT
jgi:acyl-CoA synthetase (AMP-forming)/AMP-acid ligase II